MAIIQDWMIEKHIENGDIEISPYDNDNVEPASVDLRLGSDFIKYEQPRTVIDTKDSDDGATQLERAATARGEMDSITIEQGDFVIATTKETIRLPDFLAATVVGRSSLGRLGVEIHKTAGFVDPGFEGEITLEIVNDNPNPVRLYPDQRVAQIVFYNLFEHMDAENPYGHEDSQYQNQSGATASGMQFD